jgi:hypothetical protein
VTWRNRDTGEEERCAACNLFLFVGADPNTAWLHGCWIDLDRYGFVQTGHDLDEVSLAGAGWAEERRPYPLETSIPGVFAIGDVRSGSIKRVAAAGGKAPRWWPSSTPTPAASARPCSRAQRRRRGRANPPDRRRSRGPRYFRPLARL